MFTNPMQAVRVALALLIISTLAACGGGVVTVDPPSSAVSTTNLRPLPAEYLARKAVSYSPFRTATTAAGRDGETITAAEVLQDLQLLLASDFRLIRLFDSSDQVAKLVLQVIHDNNLDIKVHLGAYVHSFKNASPYDVPTIQASNQAELDRLIALATQYPDTVLAVSVGNETMVSWSTVPIAPADMAGYIKYVRDRVTQPITTDDNFAFYAEAPKSITDLIDFASIHTYAELDTQYPTSPYYWDWKQEGLAAGPARATAMMDGAITESRAQYQVVRDALDRKGLNAVQIVIGETGWNAVDLGKLRFRASPINQKMYVDRLATWRQEGRVGPGPANIVYFEAFDEPWKGGDDKWGLFNVSRQARCVVQNFSAVTALTTAEAGSCAEADAVYFIAPPVGTAVVSNAFTLYSDASGANVQTGLRLDAFDGNTATRAQVSPSPASGDGGQSMVITPAPASYGWGLLYSSTTQYTTWNLSNFASTGTVNFWVNTPYPGQIEVGLSTLTSDGSTQQAYVKVGNGNYGYCNTANWCQVSIPLQAFLAVNPSLDYRLVLSPFIIADIYSETGKAAGSNITTPISVDGISWTQTPPVGP